MIFLLPKDLLFKNYLSSFAAGVKFWFDFCFTDLQPILGHFGRGQLP